MTDCATELFVVAFGSFAAATFAAIFGIGAGIIIVLLLSFWLPLQTVVPLMAASTLAIDSVRAWTFRKNTDWRIALPFLAGAALGVAVGSRVFFSVPEDVLGIVIGVLMLSTLWLPTPDLDVKGSYPFVAVGIAHAFASAIFAFGGLLQAAVAKLTRERENVIAILATCFAGMNMMKVIGYSVFGFDFSPYLVWVLAIALGAIPGTLLGRRMGRALTGRRFNVIFKLIVTAFAVHLIFQSQS
ncbi:MAG: sulfite exporter TauE/SafE family protein [Pseudomonadota bacterium]